MTADEVSSVPTGVIVPPPELKSIVDKTAEFVGRNGMEFERRILDREKANPKFQFLLAENPYNAYYRYQLGVASGKIKPVEEQKKEKEPEMKEGEAEKVDGKVAEEGEGGAGVVRKEAESKKIFEPKKDVYSVQLVPENVFPQPEISAVQVDVMKLTALYCARNGRHFLREIAQNEIQNPLFDFVKSYHALYRPFQDLIDAYYNVIYPGRSEIADLSKQYKDAAYILDQAENRKRWEEKEEARIAKEEAENEAEREAFWAIDWQEFVIVETVEYTEDDNVLLPPNAHGLYLQDQPEYANKMSVREDEDGEGKPAASEKEETAESSKSRDRVSEAAAATEAAKESLSAPTVDASLPVVSSYSRKRKARDTTVDPLQNMVRDPVTGQLITLTQASEHMRIELLDPAWKEQRQKEREMQESVRTGGKMGSHRAQDEDIAKNLASFASRRGDIFGASSGTQPAETKPAADAVQWDGTQANAAAAKAQARALSAANAGTAQAETGAEKQPAGPQLPQTKRARTE